MRLAGKILQRLRSMFQRARFERELDLELRFHLDMLTAQHVRAGLPPRAARRAALSAFGPMAGVKDDVRDTWLSRGLEAAVQDVRYGLRTLAAAPAFAIGVIVTIGLAVGVNTSIFGIAHSILMRPLPFLDPDQLGILRHGTTTTGALPSFSSPELDDYRAAPGIAAIAELHTMWFILLGDRAGSAGERAVRRPPERVSTGVVSANYFDLLGVQPVLGRGLQDADDRPDAPPVLVLSHAYWTRAFNADPSVVGRVFEMNDRRHTVVGVLPPMPAYPEAVDVYMPTSACPFRSAPDVVNGRARRMVRAIVRLRDGVPAGDVDDQVARIATRLQDVYPAMYGTDRYSAHTTALSEELRRTMRPTLLLLVATAGLVLLIACVSVSNLVLARLTHRSAEVSLRAALGATRGRLVRQLLTENVAVVAAGTVLGLIVAQGVLSALTDFVQRGTTLAVDRRLNGAAVTAAIVASIVLLFVSAALPMIHRRASMQGGIPRVGPGRVRYGLIVGQVGLSFVLMIAAALSVRSLLHLQGIDTGFNTEHVQTLRLDLNFTKYADHASITGFWRRVEEQLTRTPGVSAAGGAGTVPLDGRPLSSSSFQLEAVAAMATDRAPAAHEATRAPRANFRVASPGYFAALGQRLVDGRTFTREDAADRLAIVVINESLARRHWPGQSAVGRRLRLDAETSTRVIGVVEDTRQQLDEAPGDEIYLPLLQTGQLSTHWLVRSSLPPAEVERRVRAIVRAIDPEQPVDNFRTLESFRAASLLPSRVTASVVGMFSVLALVITTTGIAGVLGFTVQQRRQEFSVRLALGAKRTRVVAMVVADGLRLVATGLAYGAVTSIVLVPFMRATLSGIDTFDPATFAFVACLLLVVAAGACLVPARRAALLDPMTILRAN